MMNERIVYASFACGRYCSASAPVVRRGSCTVVQRLLWYVSHVADAKLSPRIPGIVCAHSSFIADCTIRMLLVVTILLNQYLDSGWSARNHALAQPTNHKPHHQVRRQPATHINILHCSVFDLHVLPNSRVPHKRGSGTVDVLARLPIESCDSSLSISI